MSLANIWHEVSSSAFVALELDPGHGQRVGLFAAGAARDPEPHLAASLSLGDQGKDLLLERLEYLRLSEETGDADEEILVQSLDLSWVAAEKLQVALEVLHLLACAMRRVIRRITVLCL